MGRIERGSSAAFLLIALTLSVLQMVQSANFIFGGEAKRVCDAYKLICPAKKTCALQSIEWPRVMKFPVCVHEIHVVVKSNICRKPPDPGKCKARFMRWYFNVHMDACSWFTYSGCGGNQNKFRTAEECESRCISGNNDNFEEGRSLREDGSRDEIGNVTLFKHLIDVNGDHPENREPKLITAPAPAAEMIDLDTDVTASLQLNTNAKNSTKTGKEERRKKKKEREKKKRQKDKLRRKNRRNKKKHIRNTHKSPTVEPTHQIPLSEQGPTFGPQISTSRSDDRSPNFAELTGRQTTFSKFRNPDSEDKLIWRMDKQFRRWRRHHKRLKEHVGDTYSGAKQDTYYDKVKLFDILKSQEKEGKLN